MDIEGAFFNTSDYHLQRKKLGEGTFGTVYRAKNNHDGHLYACKIIKTHGDFNGHEQMLLMRESLILHKLKHPGIVEFKGVNFQSFSNPNKLEPSIITEYLKGGSLKSILDQEKKSLSNSMWSPTKKYILLLGISNAMDYLHKQGIIHRDLKPENILTDEEFHPRICDFGLSRCFKKSLTNSDKLTMTGEIGTPIYMAPELLAGEDHYGPAVDVYSFAMIAYELVTGKVPFLEIGKNLTAVSLGIKVTNGYRPSFPEFVPKKMQKLIRRCWSEKVTDRPSFEEIFNELSSDFTYLGELVDEEEINDYLSLLGETKVEKSTDLNEENNQLRNEVAELKKKLAGYTACEEFFTKGLIELHGHEKERNVKEGLHCLNVSSEKGNSFSSLLLGLMYEAGDGVERDFDKAKFYFERSSSQGNSIGYYLIGWYYRNGFAVKQDYIKALEYYLKSADLGNSNALNNIGYLYNNGYGVKQDYIKALEYYSKSADLGNSNALNNIGYLYEFGKGVKKDYSKALEYYHKSADLGYSKAFYNIGIIYSCGEGVEKDYSKALEYYHKSADLGEPAALFSIGSLYKNGEGVKQDYSKALEYYHKSADLGYSKAFYNIGFLYYNGKGVKKDYSKALEYLQKAADLGDSKAFYIIGCIYNNGKGVKKDYSKALEYYQKAAELGNSDAFYNIGSLYEHGKGVKQDYSKALQYYKKAAELDNEDAIQRINEIQTRLRK